MDISGASLLFYVALAQGIYYAATGVWALVDIRSFQLVTGPKTDIWLVKTVGVLVVVIGAVLLVGAWRGQLVMELRLLGLGSAAALAVVEVIYVMRKRISKVYLLDAAAEAVLISVWLMGWLTERD